MSSQFECCNCRTIFEGIGYSWYFYFEKEKYQVCPNCGSKLVPDYDFEYIGLVDKIQSKSFAIGIGFLALVFVLQLESYWWHIFYVIPIFISGICTVIYNHQASEVSSNTHDTRLFKFNNHRK